MTLSRHAWGHPARFYDDRGNPTKTERECIRCGLVKVTRHDRNEIGQVTHRQEFWRDGDPGDARGTPACEPIAETAQ